MPSPMLSSTLLAYPVILQFWVGMAAGLDMPTTHWRTEAVAGDALDSSGDPCCTVSGVVQDWNGLSTARVGKVHDLDIRLSDGILEKANINWRWTGLAFYYYSREARTRESLMRRTEHFQAHHQEPTSYRSGQQDTG